MEYMVWTDIIAVAGTIGTLLFGGLSIYFYKRTRSRKDLISYTAANMAIFNPRYGLGELNRTTTIDRGDLSLNVAGTEIKEPTVLVQQIYNSGDVSIVPSEFDGPMAIELVGRRSANQPSDGRLVEIVSFAATTSSDSVKINVGRPASGGCTIEKSRQIDEGIDGKVAVLEVEPFFLQPGEHFSIHMIVRGRVKSVRTHYRISNVPSDAPTHEATMARALQSSVPYLAVWLLAPALAIGLFGWVFDVPYSNISGTRLAILYVGSGIWSLWFWLSEEGIRFEELFKRRKDDPQDGER